MWINTFTHSKINATKSLSVSKTNITSCHNSTATNRKIYEKSNTLPTTYRPITPQFQAYHPPKPQPLHYNRPVHQYRNS